MSSLIVQRGATDFTLRPAVPWKLVYRAAGSAGLLLTGVYAAAHLSGLIPLLALGAATVPVLTWSLWRLLARRLRHGGPREHRTVDLGSETMDLILKGIDMSSDARHELIVALISAIGPKELQQLSEYAFDRSVDSTVRLEIAASLIARGANEGPSSLAELMTDPEAKGEDRFAAAAMLLNQRDERGTSGLWSIAVSPMKDARVRVEAARELLRFETDESKRDKGIEPRAFRALELIANDQDVPLAFRKQAVENLAEQYPELAASALWNLIVESTVPPVRKIEFAHRMRELDEGLATVAYRALVYEASVPLVLRVEAADSLRELREADGSSALRDLLHLNGGNDLDLELGIIRKLSTG